MNEWEGERKLSYILNMLFAIKIHKKGNILNYMAPSLYLHGLRYGESQTKRKQSDE